jgi:hypothetical protein
MGRFEHITVALQQANAGQPAGFALTLAGETVRLVPGKSWSQTDHFKWVTRGLIEAPQSFHVLPDGSVDLNGENFRISDPQAVSRLEGELNKRHPAPGAALVASAAALAKPPPRTENATGRVTFRVRLDRFGHLMIEHARGEERLETGLRGIEGLIVNGLMARPQFLHVDPLLRHVELDDLRFEATPAGAAELEQVLNARYAAQVQAGHAAIAIHENPASATGFDIRFMTVRAGARFEVKGHLSQQVLDVLQDPVKSGLLHPGVVLRLSPPHLLARRRRSDGGEESLPGLADMDYRHTTAAALEAFFNHPLLCRDAGPDGVAPAAAAFEPVLDPVVALEITRQAQIRHSLWLDSVTRSGQRLGRALTHQNVVALQHSGVFEAHLDVTLSLDGKTLAVLDTSSGVEQQFTVDLQSSEAQLREASRVLTAALKPPPPKPPAKAPPPAAAPTPPPSLRPPPAAASSVGTTHHQPAPATPAAAAVAHIQPSVHAGRHEPATRPRDPAAIAARDHGRLPQAPSSDPAGKAGQAAPPPAVPEPDRVPEGLRLDAAVLGLFRETDARRVGPAVFEGLAALLGLAEQDILLSLPRVFADRRFRILSFTHPEVRSVLELRSEDFHGFYLSLISERRIDFVYACRGTHLEWGPDKCVVQATAMAEAQEYLGSGLLGLVRRGSADFYFVVDPSYREWAQRYEATSHNVGAYFITVAELAGRASEFEFVWPQLTQGGGAFHG